MKKPLMFTLFCLIAMSITWAQAEFYKPKTSVPDNKDEMIQKVEAFVNAGFKGDTESMKAIMSDDYYQFPPGTGEDSLSRDEALEDWKGLSEGWENLSWKGISTCVRDENSGNTVVFLWGQAGGKQKTSGKDVSFMNHGVYVFKEGKIFRVYSYYDTATLGRQLGMKMVPAEEGKE